MKKLMALVLAMIMLISFAGCGGNNEVQEETETFYEMGNPAGTDIVEVVLEDYMVMPHYDGHFAIEGYSFVILNYSIKNIGKTDLDFFSGADGRSETVDPSGIVGVDYNDGYIFYVDDVECSDGDTYDEGIFIGDENQYVYLRDIKPLSPAVSYEVAICVPNEVVENTDAPLLINFNLRDSNNNHVVVSYKIR